MGGWIGFGLARYFPERFNSFILGGAHPYAENTQAIRDRMPNDPAAFAAGIEKTYGALLTPARRARLLANDLDALRALTQDRDDIADVLPTMTMPSLIFCGELDPRLAQARQAASEMPNATFLGLPGCDHVGTTRRTEIIIPRIRTFLREVAERRGAQGVTLCQIMTHAFFPLAVDWPRSADFSGAQPPPSGSGPAVSCVSRGRFRGRYFRFSSQYFSAASASPARGV